MQVVIFISVAIILFLLGVTFSLAFINVSRETSYQKRLGEVLANRVALIKCAEEKYSELNMQFVENLAILKKKVEKSEQDVKKMDNTGILSDPNVN